jgi:hypothetical protein
MTTNVAVGAPSPRVFAGRRIRAPWQLGLPIPARPRLDDKPD